MKKAEIAKKAAEAFEAGDKEKGEFFRKMLASMDGDSKQTEAKTKKAKKIAFSIDNTFEENIQLYFDALNKNNLEPKIMLEAALKGVALYHSKAAPEEEEKGSVIIFPDNQRRVDKNKEPYVVKDDTLLVNERVIKIDDIVEYAKSKKKETKPYWEDVKEQ